MATHPIAAEKYVSLTSYRKNGTPKALPVWIVDLGDGTVGFTTASSSYKVKRMRANPAITLQPCNAKGEPTAGTDVVEGQARVTQEAAEFAAVRAAVKGKYKMQYTGIEIMGKLAKMVRKGSGTDTAVVITLDA